MKINILGTKYMIKNDPSLVNTNADGLCKEYEKTIAIRPVNMMCDDIATATEQQNRYNHVMRHEIIHAFFIESGLDDYSSNEQLVDWFAVQFPKIKQAFLEAGCSN